MSADKTTPEVVAACLLTGCGWALVGRSSWESINEDLDCIAAIASCSTWGEYRRLGVRNESLVELVHQETDVDPDCEPADDTPFSVDLDGYDDYERDGRLQLATTDFFAELDEDDASFPWDGVDMADMYTTVEDEYIDNVICALETRGFKVTRVEN
jgi:hypothetical protein